MAGINIAKAPGSIAVLPFYAAGALFFLLLAVLLLFSNGDLQSFYFQPHILAVVHTAAIGWGTMVIFGTSYQLFPVIYENNLYSDRLAFTSFCFLLPGAVILIISFWFFRTGRMMISGGSLVLIAVALYFINIWKTTSHCKKYFIQKCFFISAAFWLLFTVTVGLLLAVNLSYPFFDKNQLTILKLHAHAGLAGWFLQLITGASSKLAPMFLLSKIKNDKMLYYSFGLQNAGLLLFEADGYFNGITYRTFIYLLIVCAGISAYGIYLYSAFKNRVKKPLDFQMKQTFSSFIFLALAILCIPLVYTRQGGHWTMIYGCLLFIGWISTIILGQTFKTLPFIIWNNLYKKINHKVKVPLPKQLYSETLLRYQFVSFWIAIVLLITGLMIDNLLIIRLALWGWLIVALLYVLNVRKILMHKIKGYRPLKF